MDVKNTVATIRYFSGWADKITGKTIETTENKMAYTRQEPFGVVVSLLFIHSHPKLSAYNVSGLHLALECPSCILFLFSSWTVSLNVVIGHGIVEIGSRTCDRQHCRSQALRNDALYCTPAGRSTQ